MSSELSAGELQLPLLIFIVGPTASGKSAFAVDLAEAIGAHLKSQSPATGLAPVMPEISHHMMPEIINGDSIQFFQGVEIGAAKPEAELLERVPHHLVSVVKEGDAFTAGDFRRAALRTIEEANARGVRVLLCVGGSGFYLQALEKGMYPVPDVPPEVRAGVEADLEKQGPAIMYQELLERDPETAKGIQPQDRYRISRSLEVLRASKTGETLSEMKRRFESERPPAEFRIFKIGIERSRENLRTRVEQRTKNMIKAGLVEEVKSLRSKGLSSWPPLSSVGYHEVQEMLEGRLPEDQMSALISTSTLQLAKRQMTWFRRDKATLWVNLETVSNADAVALALKEVAPLLGS